MTASRFRLAVFIVGESFMLLVFAAAPLSLESVLVTLGGVCSLFILWAFSDRRRP